MEAIQSKFSLFPAASLFWSGGCGGYVSGGGYVLAGGLEKSIQRLTQSSSTGAGTELGKSEKKVLQK